MAYAEYAAQQLPRLQAPADNPGMYEPVTAENALNACCGHLLTTIGLARLYPEPTSQINSIPASMGPSMALGDVMRAAMFR